MLLRFRRFAQELFFGNYGCCVGWAVPTVCRSVHSGGWVGTAHPTNACFTRERQREHTPRAWAWHPRGGGWQRQALACRWFGECDRPSASSETFACRCHPQLDRGAPYSCDGAAGAAKTRENQRKFAREDEISTGRGAGCFSTMYQNLSVPLYWTVTQGGPRPLPDGTAGGSSRQANIVWNVSDYGAFRRYLCRGAKGNPPLVPISVTMFFPNKVVSSLGASEHG